MTAYVMFAVSVTLGLGVIALSALVGRQAPVVAGIAAAVAVDVIAVAIAATITDNHTVVAAAPLAALAVCTVLRALVLTAVLVRPALDGCKAMLIQTRTSIQVAQYGHATGIMPAAT